MRNLQTVKENVTVLKKDDGELTASDKETADLLGHHFENMFTNEDTDSIPSAEVPDALWDDSNMEFSVSCVTNKLMKLHTDKSMGPDGIHSLLLRECATQWQSHLL